MTDEPTKLVMTVDRKGGLVCSAEVEAQMLAAYDRWKESNAPQDSDAQAEPPPEAAQASANR